MRPLAGPRSLELVRPRRWGAVLVLALLVALSGLLPRRAAAAPPPDPSPAGEAEVGGAEADRGQPVIVPGREGEITALFRPHALGDELSPGWTLGSFSIDLGTITVWLAGPEDRHAALTLDHPDHGPDGARPTTGFAAQIVAAPPGSEAALDALLAAIEANDDGSFWARKAAFAADPIAPPPTLEEQAGQLRESVLRWVGDGVLILVGLCLTLLILVAHGLRGAPAWIKWSLPALVVGGALLRLALSPAVALAPWPYTRRQIVALEVFEGPVLAWLHPDPVWLSETIIHTTLLFSILAPLAVYAHARYLLDDRRAAWIVALIVAVLPLHLRFSHSDAAFIPSITVSSVAFALIHAGTRERRPLAGWVALALVGLPIALMFLVRPLNIMYSPLLLATVFVNSGLHSDKPRVGWPRILAMAGVVVAVTGLVGVPNLLENFGEQVNEGLSWRTIAGALGVIVNPRLNILLNPVFTPPGLTLLAALGAVDLWRRRRRALLLFLLAWLLGFLVAHAYVIPRSTYMQARYHLHLVVPYLLLVACGADAGLRWLERERERRPWLAGPRYDRVRAGALAYVLASPLIHLHAIRHVELNDAREWLFVHSLREQIPAACTIVEYSGSGADLRFGRVGTFVEGGVTGERWRVVGMATPGPGEPEIPEELRALFDDPPDCLYWYEGLPCFGNKPVEEPRAPSCHAIPGFLELEEVAVERFESVAYDENLAGGLGSIEAIELRLFRARPR